MNYLEYLPVWNRLSAAQQRALRSSASERVFHKGTLLHAGAGGCAGLILVLSGQLRAFILSESGKEITLYRLFERDICLFSASCMMNSIQFDIAIAAEKDTRALLIPAEIYKSVMNESAPLANFTNEVMGSRFSDVMWLMDQILWKSFDTRLAEFLLNEAGIEGSSTLRITHENIGNHLGSPREVVTRMLKYFAQEGMVRLARGTIEITDPERLRSCAEK